MVKNKKNNSANKPEKKANLHNSSKKKRSLTVWDHHDTMIVNLRMWVEKAIENLSADIKSHAPGLVGKPSLVGALNKAHDLNVQLWDQIRLAQEMADSHKEKGAAT